MRYSYEILHGCVFQYMCSFPSSWYGNVVVISGYLILIWGKKLHEYKITRKLRKEEREGSSVQKPFQDGNKYTCNNPRSLKFKDQKKPAKFIGELLLEQVYICLNPSENLTKQSATEGDASCFSELKSLDEALQWCNKYVDTLPLLTDFRTGISVCLFPTSCSMWMYKNL